MNGSTKSLGVSSQHSSRVHSRAAIFCLSLCRLSYFFLSQLLQPITVTDLLFLPAGFSQPSANSLFVSLLHPRSLWLSPPQIPLLLCLSISKWRGAQWAPKESKKHPEQPTISPACPVPMIAGKYVFIRCLHWGNALWVFWVHCCQ